MALKRAVVFIVPYDTAPRNPAITAMKIKIEWINAMITNYKNKTFTKHMNKHE